MKHAQPKGKTLRAKGFEDGAEGYPMKRFGGIGGAQYRDGWYHGYRYALTRELKAYNREHGTNYQPRGPY